MVDIFEPVTIIRRQNLRWFEMLARERALARTGHTDQHDEGKFGDGEFHSASCKFQQPRLQIPDGNGLRPFAEGIGLPAGMNDERALQFQIIARDVQ